MRQAEPLARRDPLSDFLLTFCRYGPGGWSGGFTIAATTYLDDVKQGGGGFYFFPRSHRAVHQFFLRNPEQIDGSFYIRQDVSARFPLRVPFPLRHVLRPFLLHLHLPLVRLRCCCRVLTPSSRTASLAN